MKMTKKLLVISLVCLSWTLHAQDSVRVVTKTPRNGHEIYGSKGANDPKLLYYVDSEKIPFTGKFIELGWDNEKKNERNYVNGELEGVYIKWDKRGDDVYVVTNGTYRKGKLFGEYTEWWRPNHKKKVCYYDENSELDGKVTFYDGFSKETPKTIQFYNHGKRDSTWIWYYEPDKIRTIQNYKNGKEHGVRIDYYKNGNKKKEIIYANDVKHGETTSWYENGKVKYECNYNEGKKDGKELYYYENGQLEKEGFFVLDKKKGKFVFYNKDGSIQEETTF